MKVLVADTFEQSGLDGLAAIGCEVVYQPDVKEASLVDAVRNTGAAVLVVRSTQVTEAVLDAGALSLIVRAGAGVNTIDVAGASRRGIYVSNCPGKNAVAVAELATCGFVGRGENVVLQGLTGTGKTYLACALAKAACARRVRSCYVRQPDLEDLWREIDDGFDDITHRVFAALRVERQRDVLELPRWTQPVEHTHVRLDRDPNHRRGSRSAWRT